MAKIISYKFKSGDDLIETSISCDTQEIFDLNYTLAKKEAVGEITVEGEFETEQPTQLDRIEAQITYTAMMTDTLLEV